MLYEQAKFLATATKLPCAERPETMPGAWSGRHVVPIQHKGDRPAEGAWPSRPPVPQVPIASSAHSLGIFTIARTNFPPRPGTTTNPTELAPARLLLNPIA